MASDPTTEKKAREALARNPFPDMPWIDVRDDGIVIATGYSEALHRLLRWVPKAQWRPAERAWLVPFSGAEAVRAVLPEISRLAEAARELDEPRVVEPPAETRAELVAEAAGLLDGPDRQAILDLEPAAISDRFAEDVAGKLRQKAAVLTHVAERIEAILSTARRDERARS